MDPEQDQRPTPMASDGTPAPDTLWRIDDLAHRSGIGVDTIRFYQREGLLPPAERGGRARLYGPGHLHQLERIRDLQARHFSIGAIKALVEEGRLGLVETIFGSSGATYTRDELVSASGLPEPLVAQLESFGLPSRPEGAEADVYDGSDLEVLRALQGLLDRGMPQSMVLVVARLYVKHFAAMERDILALFTARDDQTGISEEEMEQFENRARVEIANILPHMNTILSYVQHRAVQRITLLAMEEADRRHAGKSPETDQHTDEGQPGADTTDRST